MSDNVPNPSEDTSQMQRVFKIGNNLIVEDDDLIGLTNEEVQAALSFSYPEIANATMTTSVQDGRLVVEYMNRPGRKG